jgi:hypothetical protein
MIDVVSAHVLIVGFFPTEWKFVADAIREGLRLRKPTIKIKRWYTFWATYSSQSTDFFQDIFSDKLIV